MHLLKAATAKGASFKALLEPYMNSALSHNSVLLLMLRTQISVGSHSMDMEPIPIPQDTCAAYDISMALPDHAFEQSSM
jgi:hypothetical protein